MTTDEAIKILEELRKVDDVTFRFVTNEQEDKYCLQYLPVLCPCEIDGSEITKIGLGFEIDDPKELFEKLVRKGWIDMNLETTQYHISLNDPEHPKWYTYGYEGSYPELFYPHFKVLNEEGTEWTIEELSQYAKEHCKNLNSSKIDGFSIDAKFNLYLNDKEGHQVKLGYYDDCVDKGFTLLFNEYYIKEIYEEFEE